MLIDFQPWRAPRQAPTGLPLRINYPRSQTETIFSLVQALGEIFNLYQWNEFSFFYAVQLDSLIPRCMYVQSDMDAYISTNDNMTMVYKRSTANDSYDSLRSVLKRMKTRTRILVTCFENASDRRNFMLAAIDEGLTTNEYVFIYLQVKQDGFGKGCRNPRA